MNDRFKVVESQSLQICDVCGRSEVSMILDGTSPDLLPVYRDTEDETGLTLCAECLEEENNAD